MTTKPTIPNTEKEWFERMARLYLPPKQYDKVIKMTKPTINNTVSLETAKRLEEARKAAGVEWPIEFESHVYEDRKGRYGGEYPKSIYNGGPKSIESMGIYQLYPAPNVAELLALIVPYLLSHLREIIDTPLSLADHMVKQLELRKELVLEHWAEKFPLEKNP